MHQDPRLRIEQSVVRSFLPIHDPVLHGEQIGPGQPNRIAQNFRERFQVLAFNLIAQKVGFIGQI